MSTRTERLAYITRKQYGLASTGQLLGIGFTRSAIKNAHRRGELVPSLTKVWRVAAAPRCWEQRPMGAVLSCGPVTVASHLTGAHLHAMLPRRTGAIEVTTDRCPKPRSGIIIHRAALEPVEIVIIQGIPCTSVARTLIDLCATSARTTSSTSAASES